MHLQEVGREYGTTTGRRRRCGWLDLVVLKHSCLINGYTSFNVTKLDVLDAIPLIKIATGYFIDGVELEGFPADLGLLEKPGFEVRYVEMKGWEKDITGVRRYEDLPDEAKKYLDFIGEFSGVPVEWIGVGPGRESMIKRPLW